MINITVVSEKEIIDRSIFSDWLVVVSTKAGYKIYKDRAGIFILGGIYTADDIMSKVLEHNCQ